jgi:hypothetical protein
MSLRYSKESIKFIISSFMEFGSFICICIYSVKNIFSLYVLSSFFITNHLYFLRYFINFYKESTRETLEKLESVIYCKILISLICGILNMNSLNWGRNICIITGMYYICQYISTLYFYYLFDKFIYNIPSLNTIHINVLPSPVQEPYLESVDLEVIIQENLIEIEKYECIEHMCSEDPKSSTEGEKECENCLCSICLEEMNNKIVHSTKCNHIFHKDCIIEYTRRIDQENHNINIKCPNCREVIFSK